MHIHRLRLHAYGHFEDKLLSFAEPGKLSLVYGPNEAGKSTALYALEAFLFGLMDRRVAVSYEQAWTKSKLKVTGWLSANADPQTLVELQRSNAGVQDRLKTGAQDWLPVKGQRGLFKDLFALDGERLRAEASRVLAAGGSAGEALGVALLGEQAESQCKRLEEQVEALFKPRGRNQTINALRAELEALDKAIAEQSLSAQDWLGQDRAAKEAQSQADALEHQRKVLRDHQAMLERDAKRLLADQALAEVKAQWQTMQEQHPGLPALGRDDLARLEALERERSALAGAMNQRLTELEALKQQIQALHLDDSLWQAHEAAVSDLGQGYDQAERLFDAWTALQANRPQDLLASDDLAEVDVQADGRPPAEHLDRLGALSDRAAVLPPIPPVPQAPDLPAQISAKGLAWAEVEALLAPERGLAQSCKGWRAEQQRLQREAQEIAMETRTGERALAEAAIACQHLQDQGAGLDNGPMLEARRHRDQLWNKLKRDLGQASLQEAYEVAVLDADRAAEAFARSERQAGAWQHAQRQQAEANLKVSAAQARAAALAKQESALVQQLVEALGLDDTALEPLLALAEQVLSCQAALQSWYARKASRQAAQNEWQALADQAAQQGFQPQAKGQLDKELRDWLNAALQDARAAQARLDKYKLWQGFRDQETALHVRIAAVVQHAESQGLSGLMGQGLEPADRTSLLAQAFAQERKQRQDHARLNREYTRQNQAQQADQARLSTLNEQRGALVPAEQSDLALLHAASALQIDISAQSQARAALGDCEAWHDLAVLADERAALEARDQALNAELSAAHQAAGEQRQALRALQQRDGARDLRFERSAKLERLRQATRQYLDVGLQARLLRAALNRFLEQQQDALLAQASQAFEHLTGGAYRQLEQRRDQDGVAQFWISDALGDDKGLEQLSEGTKDQLYLSLRLAALDQYGLSQLATQAGALPLICDDLLVQFDDDRAARALALLAERRERQQVIYFTHHKHLLELARQHLPSDSFEALDLSQD